MVFFFNDTATTEIYTLSLHDALPIFDRALPQRQTGGDHLLVVVEQLDDEVLVGVGPAEQGQALVLLELRQREGRVAVDRKSTRLNSSHANISYAVFCLKKKQNTNNYR